MILLEGNWKHILEYFEDVPKDSVILLLDGDDPFETKDSIGNYQSIIGGAQLDKLKFWDKQQCIDYTKKVFDKLAPVGGFIFSTDKSIVSPGDLTANLIDVFNFAHEYGRY